MCCSDRLNSPSKASFLRSADNFRSSPTNRHFQNNAALRICAARKRHWPPVEGASATWRIAANIGHVVGGLIGQDKDGAVRAKGAELAFHFWGLICAKHEWLCFPSPLPSWLLARLNR